MCGIAGFAGPNARGADERGTLERMIGAVAHRGPDGYGFYQDPHVGLAHARLSIIDLATGDQPIRNETGSVQVVFNGEIFNYVELRADLEKRGHRFYTRSDTEVIVHLYEEHGDDFARELNGQFAIALWDRDTRRLLLVRDRAGIRPLFYAQAKGQLWFASEVKSLFAAAPELAEVDPRGLAQVFTFWAALEPDTIYRRVSSVPPGHRLCVEADGSIRCEAWWDWTFPAARDLARGSVDDAARELRALLVDAVRLQLRADVPVGAYLSGGLDSSAIVAMIRGFTTTPVRTFSVSFEDAEFDESEHQLAMVRHLGTDHTTLRCRREEIGAAFPALIRHTETPVLRTAAVPLMLLSAEVRRQGYKVVLTGEGADEVFGGYDLFREAKVRRFWAAQPASKWRTRLFARLYSYLGHSPVASDAMARSFFGRDLDSVSSAVFAHLPRWTTSARALNFLSPELRASLGDWRPRELYERRMPAAARAWSPLARDQYVEAKTLLAGYLLASQGDRVAMANSIEGRFPFLDHRVIEFANTLPDRWKIRGLTEKYLFRRAMAGLLPDEIMWRTKQPYRAPDSQSFFSAGRALPYVDDLLAGDRLRRAGYFDAAAVGKLFEKCRNGRALGFADNQAFTGILSTMLVDELFIRGGGI